MTEANGFNSGIGGSLPWGLQYDFSGNIAERYLIRHGSL